MNEVLPLPSLWARVVPRLYEISWPSAAPLEDRAKKKEESSKIDVVKRKNKLMDV